MKLEGKNDSFSLPFMVKVMLTLTRFISALILSLNGDGVTDMACVLLCYMIFLELLDTHKSCLFWRLSLQSHWDFIHFSGQWSMCSEVCIRLPVHQPQLEAASDNLSLSIHSCFWMSVFPASGCFLYLMIWNRIPYSISHGWDSRK